MSSSSSLEEVVDPRVAVLIVWAVFFFVFIILPSLCIRCLTCLSRFGRRNTPVGSSDATPPSAAERRPFGFDAGATDYYGRGFGFTGFDEVERASERWDRYMFLSSAQKRRIDELRAELLGRRLGRFTLKIGPGDLVRLNDDGEVEKMEDAETPALAGLKELEKSRQSSSCGEGCFTSKDGEQERDKDCSCSGIEGHKAGSGSAPTASADQGLAKESLSAGRVDTQTEAELGHNGEIQRRRRFGMHADDIAEAEPNQSQGSHERGLDPPSEHAVGPDPPDGAVDSATGGEVPSVVVYVNEVEGENSIGAATIEDDAVLDDAGRAEEEECTTFVPLTPSALLAHDEDDGDIIHVAAPPGRLGFSLEDPSIYDTLGMVVVWYVSPDGPLADRLCVGDRIYFVDGIDVTRLPASAVSVLLTSKALNPQRSLTVLRTRSGDPAAKEGCVGSHDLEAGKLENWYTHVRVPYPGYDSGGAKVAADDPSSLDGEGPVTSWRLFYLRRAQIDAENELRAKEREENGGGDGADGNGGGVSGDRAPNDRRNVPRHCAICLGEYELNEEVTWSSNAQCTHIFHKGCVIEWLVALGRKTTKYQMFSEIDPTPAQLNYGLDCPCCRQAFVSRSALRGREDDGESTPRMHLQQRAHFGAENV